MILNDYEILMLLKFHQSYWQLENFLSLKRPHIISFCGIHKIPRNARNLNILALFYFNYWFLKYAYQTPSIAQIKFYYSELKENPSN